MPLRNRTGNSVAIRTHAPDSDAHILCVGADGRDLAVHLAGPLPGAAGHPLVAELAQLLYLHSRGLWCNRTDESDAECESAEVEIIHKHARSDKSG